MPHVYEQLRENHHAAEKHYKDIQDFEFTIQDGKLNAADARRQRTGLAAGVSRFQMVMRG